MISNILSDLKFGRIIGRGAFGVVYEAKDKIHGKVAVKVFRKEKGEDDEDWKIRKKELLEEGQRLKDAEHERIVRVYNLGERVGKDEVCLVMEYYKNGCLEDRCKQGPLPVKQIRSFLNDAALGLQVIHHRNMIHRDIKPSNILIDDAGRAKIGDFGVVTNRIYRGYGSGHGDQTYWAPEVFVPGLTSQKTDVWAFGMTTYRLLHGTAYIKQHLPNLFDIEDAICSGKFALKLPWLPHIPTDWKRFVRQAMNHESNKRHQSVEELQQGLRRLTVEPNWECQYTSDRVLWERSTHKRKIQVEWIIESDRKHHWQAKSIPLSSGRELTLGKSQGAVSRKEAISGLESFFSSQT